MHSIDFFKTYFLAKIYTGKIEKNQENLSNNDVRQFRFLAFTQKVLIVKI